MSEKKIKMSEKKLKIRVSRKTDKTRAQERLHENIIAKIEAYPEIYDLENPLHIDRDYIRHTYEKIAKELVTVRTLKTKWRSLKNGFTRERTLQELEGRSGQGKPTREPYQFYEQLRFLNKFVRKRQSISTIDDSDEEDGNIENAIEEDSQNVSQSVDGMSDDDTIDTIPTGLRRSPRKRVADNAETTSGLATSQPSENDTSVITESTNLQSHQSVNSVVPDDDPTDTASTGLRRSPRKSAPYNVATSSDAATSLSSTNVTPLMTSSLGSPEEHGEHSGKKSSATPKSRSQNTPSQMVNSSPKKHSPSKIRKMSSSIRKKLPILSPVKDKKSPIHEKRSNAKIDTEISHGIGQIITQLEAQNCVSKTTSADILLGQEIGRRLDQEEDLRVKIKYRRKFRDLLSDMEEEAAGYLM